MSGHYKLYWWYRSLQGRSRSLQGGGRSLQVDHRSLWVGRRPVQGDSISLWGGGWSVQDGWRYSIENQALARLWQIYSKYIRICYGPICNFWTILKPSGPFQTHLDHFKSVGICLWASQTAWNGSARFKAVGRLCKDAIEATWQRARMPSKQCNNEQGCHRSNVTMSNDAIESVTTSKDAIKRVTTSKGAFKSTTSKDRFKNVVKLRWMDGFKMVQVHAVKADRRL